jgi:hypothetical protein
LNLNKKDLFDFFVKTCPFFIGMDGTNFYLCGVERHNGLQPGPLAQWLERLTHNQGVVGSSPTGTTLFLQNQLIVGF